MIITPKDKISGYGHQLDRFIVGFPFYFEPIECLQDYHDMVFDYLCLREWAPVEIKKVSTLNNQKIIKNKKEINISRQGLEYYIFDSKWYVELCNNTEFLVSGHFRHQNYADGTRKLIWINEFKKHGYHCKALIDKYKDGELILE